jgi:cytochrome c553
MADFAERRGGLFSQGHEHTLFRLNVRDWLMKAFASAAVIATLLAAAPFAARAQERAAEKGPPDWAFAMDPPETPEFIRQPGDDDVRHVSSSKLGFSRKQANERHDVADWHPDRHPPAPNIVSHGKMPWTSGCAYCHHYNGMGTPVNAPLAGLPVDYFVRQIKNYVSGTRGSAVPAMGSFHSMAVITAGSLTDDEVLQAATYFSSLKRVPWIKVIETSMVQKYHSFHYVMTPDHAGGREPIGNRIIETPLNAVSFDLRDDGEGFIAYVPPGSIKKGKALATEAGNGKTIPCITCHGKDLKGGRAPDGTSAPYLASGSPSNIVRQLYNFQSGARKGADLMMSVVQNLTMEDMVNLGAYLASIQP